MGIYSRDYIRDTRPVGQFGGRTNLWAIKFLIIANIVVFVAQDIPVGVPRYVEEQQTQRLVVVDDGKLTSRLHLERSGLKSFQIWRLLTYGFCHDTGNLEHILFNMFILWMFGRAIEPIYGSREFLAFYLCGVVTSGFCHVLFSKAPVVGASGGVMAVVFLTAMIYPRMKVLLFFVIPMELRWLAVLYALSDMFGLFGSGTNHVANAAHLGGAAFGVAYKYFNWNIMRRVGDFTAPRKLRIPGTGPRLRVHRPATKDLKDQVDAILAKIHDQGESSLTRREREILKEASQKYKNH